MRCSAFLDSKPRVAGWGRAWLVCLACLALLTALALAGCSAAPSASSSKLAPATGGGPATPTTKHPLAKFIEFGGFRLKEMGAGKLEVKFVAVNHSEADLGELGVKIRLATTAAKPDDPPVTEFAVKIPSLGPEEIRDVSAAGPTKLRVYEIPDWQFLRAEFEITSPAP